MNGVTAEQGDDAGGSRNFLIGLGRGAAGAMLFGIPMLMTMELWQLGFYIERWRLLLLLIANIPLLILLADQIGFERTSTVAQACRDATIAYGLGIIISAVGLVMLGDIKPHMPLSEMLGKIAIQSVPASIGALLGRSQLGGQTGGDEREDGAEEREGGDAVPDEISTSYSRELFLMAVGALFLNLNVAPTEEIILIAYKMTPWHALLTIGLSIAIMHGFVYAVAFKGTHEISKETPWWHAFFRFTLPGYLVAMLISLYVLWTFGRLDDTAPTQMLMSAVVLSFPGAIGAAAARLIL
ncbi:TIGR02587 family membrane protein [Neorhizobium galegae]|uniref:Putative integral membrane protein TIGR02587 n=1 Tax=Neorhizobium galegae bv. orientalis str. HAMBI 540 TaxID=1028800 RepID=A0A068SY57_NEOGA|nr:TIGR02587 family membrane protein [Neorhizobium galegae]MCQ1851536.1 TIGR02587 family membrane protein [Neorhizobium galegae]CDN50756.1 Putative integral membrane protein TIGR02587 [Neorhizobium galegae bv. orientalis str. HAMBI 540]CDZ43628.1 Putative integral membrane protein TIGR02587 [Neorhizobium galegae bv. orientalis]